MASVRSSDQFPNQLLDREQVERIRQLLSVANLEIHLKREWGSRAPDHRESIHSEVKKKMAHAYPLSDSSISHCQSMGGFVFAQQEINQIFQIGFDIEEFSRIKPQVARRICQSDQEFEEAPSPASLWTAKEAAFKSLKGPHQPATVSELELAAWTQIDSQTETVKIKYPKKYSLHSALGLIIKKNEFSLAFFICHP